ncbi:tyrosine-protein kinase SRK2-like isoform X1 [Biomphalaria glabrata]|uniref:Tyrosine-protein kinase n=3 Tax=Biomphalaria TaxID=6525 RepID=A0A2C9JSN7_BIOGL|nr:tyrosine-protein kinase SRK2-like isoform X1 [Biomphalaria glabrata]
MSPKWLTMARPHNDSSSLKEKLQEDFLSCKICLEPLKRPKALPCLHSFCELCLQDYARRNPGNQPGYFPCPMCRKSTQVPLSGVSGFPDNFILLSLADTIQEENWESPCDSGQRYQASPPRSLYPPSPRELRHRAYDWYFGKVSRNASEEWLLAPDYPKGTFLVRLGEMSPDTYTLSVRDCDELRGYLVKHYKIITKKMPDGKECYFISKLRPFFSLADLVKHYQESVDGLCCKLASTCAKPRSLIWAMERGKEDEFQTKRSTLHLIKKLGSGQFAEVWQAKWQGSIEVAVKMQNINCVTTAAFLDEAQILKTLQHPNILELRGVCSEKEPCYLLMEYMPHGQLSKYLRETGASLPLSQLIYIGAQIADAMAYMEKEKFVHRNLGARNILVGDNNRIKVAGFGMTKAMDDPDFNFRRGLKMAIKWMAPEVLLYNKYSTKADVWSFGIVLMEIFTFGKEPYEDKASKEAFESVRDGYRMPKPDNCPQEVYDVMLSCWQNNAHSRPSFDFLNTFLNDFES